MKNKPKLPMRDCRACGGSGREQDDKAIGKAMQAAREKAGLTLREVGERIGYSTGYISDLEHGRKHWSDDLMVNYRAALKPGGAK